MAENEDPAGDEGKGDAGKAQPAETGYPANTPLEQMSTEQRESYWKTQARKHEDRAKAFGKLTAEELAGLRDKASRHDALEHELMSDKDKAVAEAKTAAESEASGKFLPKLVAAEFRAASAGRVAADKLEAALKFTDMSKFVKDGEVDSALVSEFVASLAPEKVASKGPTSFGLGAKARTGDGPGAQGKAMAEKRFGTPA